MKMKSSLFRKEMEKIWPNFFRAPYQLACQLALYCEAEDGFYYPRFDHDITNVEAQKYLEHWINRYYIPNPYTGSDGFKDLECPTYVIKSLYDYILAHPNTDYATAYKACFQDDAKNNDDIVRNYINKFSKILKFSKEGILSKTDVNPNVVFGFMDKNNKKEFFDNMTLQEEISLMDIYNKANFEKRQQMFYDFMKHQKGLKDSTVRQYAYTHAVNEEVVDVVKNIGHKNNLFEVIDVITIQAIYGKIKSLPVNIQRKNALSSSIMNYKEFIDYLETAKVSSDKTGQHELYMGQSTNNNWIIPCNNASFRIIDLFDERTYIDLEKQPNANYKVGDTVYIYCSGEEKRILFKTKVTDIDIPYNSKAEDDKFAVGDIPSQEEREKNTYFRLQLEGKLKKEDGRLSLPILQNLGLKENIQGPMYVPTPELQQKLDEVFDNKEDDDDDKNDNDVLNFLDAKPSQTIYYGAPGTGKSHTIKEKEDKGLRCVRTTFHPDSDYSTFVGCYKPHRNRQTKELTYEFVEQAFLEAYKMAWQNPQQEIALVIEEINRGNCAQIFGDIFQLLDRDDNGWSSYPIKADTDICDHLEDMNIEGYSATMAERYGADKAGFGFMALPPNLSILATMNTSDQSLFPIDSAFKRRWDWKYIPIAQGKDDEGNLLQWNIETSAKINSWWNFLRSINQIVESTTHSEDKELGFFFCKADENGKIGEDKFVNKVVFYLWNDVFKTYGFRSDIFDKDADGTEKLAFRDFYKKDGSVDSATVALFVNNVMKHLPKDEAAEGNLGEA